MASAVPIVPTGRRNKDWAPLFSPALFAQENKKITTGEYQLKPKELRSLAIQVIQIRAAQMETVKDLVRSLSTEAESKMDPNLDR